MKIHILTTVAPNVGEYYLSSGPMTFTKYLFWELMKIDGPHAGISSPSDVYIEHASKIENKKAYWDEPSWFITDADTEARTVLERYRTLTRVCGEEQPGHARCGNPTSGGTESRVYNAQPELESNGISFWS
jgi:hypothetical protein